MAANVMCVCDVCVSRVRVCLRLSRVCVCVDNTMIHDSSHTCNS